ncbi:MAG TPA: hypothetical protein LFW14_04695 [Rickettsia endosymbiont of Degeeriella rufa]|nr:hypothetical protein [Rickettsia endosymbiont of Columbicola hoogstraali]HJD62839.1 hypothetical protein [Rickettsia endosymbiont of Degeeriella rufa]
MIEYDPKDIGLKVNERHPNIRKILELFIIPEQKEYCIGYIHGKILECMTNKDVVTAIAIAN